MQIARLGKSDIDTSRLVYGCMRMAELRPGDVAAVIRAALDAGYTHFDHADIYGAGASEERFGRFLRDHPSLRDGIVITSKCGIRFAGDPDADSPQRYDFSPQHIERSVEGSLGRLGIEQLDVLLLHRPDYLMRADEVAGALQSLQRTGKVRHLGVSNFNPSQVALLQSRLSEPLCVNQVEINLRNPSALHDGTLDQCQQLGMTPQSWSPLGGLVHAGWGEVLDAGTESRVRAELKRQAERYGSDDWIVLLAWLMFHPAGIVPVIGSTSPARIRAAPDAFDIDYRRDDWYRLFEARMGAPVP